DPRLFRLAGRQAAVLLLGEARRAVAARKLIPVIGRHRGPVVIRDDERSVLWRRALVNRRAPIVRRRAASPIGCAGIALPVSLPLIAVALALLRPGGRRQGGAEDSQEDEGGAHALRNAEP